MDGGRDMRRYLQHVGPFGISLTPTFDWYVTNFFGQDLFSTDEGEASDILFQVWWVVIMVSGQKLSKIEQEKGLEIEDGLEDAETGDGRKEIHSGLLTLYCYRKSRPEV